MVRYRGASIPQFNIHLPQVVILFFISLELTPQGIDFRMASLHFFFQFMSSLPVIMPMLSIGKIRLINWKKK